MSFSYSEHSSAKPELNYKGADSWNFITIGNSHLFPVTQTGSVSICMGTFSLQCWKELCESSPWAPHRREILGGWLLHGVWLQRSISHIFHCSPSGSHFMQFVPETLGVQFIFCYSLWDLKVHSFLFIKNVFLFSQSRTVQVLNSCNIKVRLYIFLSRISNIT